MATMASDEHTSARRTLRSLAVATLVGAAAIHFGNAPLHLEEAVSHGVFFVVVAWAQLAAALAILLRADRTGPWLATLALSSGVITVWVVSRTVGLPGDGAEPVAFADALATILEVIACLAVLAAFTGFGRTVATMIDVRATGIVALAMVVAVSFSLTPTVTAGHADDDQGAVDGHAQGPAGGASDIVAVDHDDRCDIGFNTALFNATSAAVQGHTHDDDGSGVDFTLEAWADVFVDPNSPMGGGEAPDVGVAALEESPLVRDAILSGTATHSLEPDPWLPMTDLDQCEQLAAELRLAEEVAASYPTAADAIAVGYQLTSFYLPGMPAHYTNLSYVDERFEIGEPEMLLFDGDGEDANIVGLSYYVIREGDEPPEAGYTGPNDQWHRHLGLCRRDHLVIGSSAVTDAECAAMGGRRDDGDGGTAWMSHVWIVPGCESDWGLYSHANPALAYRGMNPVPIDSGCGTGKRPLVDDPAFEDGGTGPSL